jgi:hypothetical protein
VDAEIKVWSPPQVIEIAKPTEPEPREPTPPASRRSDLIPYRILPPWTSSYPLALLALATVAGITVTAAAGGAASRTGKAYGVNGQRVAVIERTDFETKTYGQEGRQIDTIKGGYHRSRRRRSLDPVGRSDC